MKPHTTARRNEAGSAYVVTLLALVVLTILALSLTMITQTEVQVGANEKTVNRTFYAADSGLGLAAAEALTSSRYMPLKVLLNQNTVGNYSTGDWVTVSAFVPILMTRCDWCPANDDGVPKFFKTTHAVTATVQRLAWTGTWSGVGDPPAAATLLGQKSLSAMFEFQPWANPPVVEAIPDDVNSLQQVKF